MTKVVSSNCIGGDGCDNTHRTNQTNPSVAVCFFSFNSFTTRDCRVADSAGAACCLSLTFYNRG